MGEEDRLDKKVIPFPGRNYSWPVPKESLKQKLISGEAEHLGSFERNGETCDYYRLLMDNEITYIFNIRD
ncbi:MAG: hypothetical protein ACM3TT_00680 [Syntrophothermus sp.]